LNSPDIIGLIRFYMLVSGLKQLRRQGWIDRGVEDPESVAAHSWGVSVLGWLLAASREDIDYHRIVHLALAHDLAEVLTGDITPFDSDRTEQGDFPVERFYAEPIYTESERKRKHEREAEAIDSLMKNLPADMAEMVHSAWREYDRGETAEAKYVKQLDKLETLLQAEIYRTAQPELVIESFWRGAQRDIEDADLKAVLEALVTIE
jgi:putative hydrolase of HD superfamily